VNRKLPSQTNQKNSVPLYMAFADGVYHYVCAECNALCCRGQGFGGNLKREIQPLFNHYPALESMAYMRKGNFV
jgi:hypothetical protein